MLLLLSVFGLAALGILAAFAAYVVVRFSVNDEMWAPLCALLAWAAVLVGTSAFIIQVVAGHISAG